MLGIKKGTVLLCDHEVAWEIEAKETIARLKGILGDVAKEIEHVGSTAIPSIKAKPIVDLAVAVDRFEDVLALEVPLREAGFYYRPNSKGLKDQILFACGSNYDGTGDLQTHFIHVVLKNSMEWKNYINFRNYLNANPGAAKEYENLKIALFEQAPEDPGREKYTAGKHDFVTKTLRDALIYAYEAMPTQADDTLKHYDLLIDEGNDPVCDPPQLQKYMDQWDGEAFFDMLHLSQNDTVLELGVGTGRLALKIAPKCKEFCGIDLSPKTAKRASEHLQECKNATVLTGDFITSPPQRTFDLIYSSLTFLHIQNKWAAIKTVASLLKQNGRFVLSVSKDRSEILDYGTRVLRVYPDDPREIRDLLTEAGLTLTEEKETEFAYLFGAKKQ